MGLWITRALMALRTLVTDLEMSAAETTKAASIGQDVGLSWVGAGAVMGSLLDTTVRNKVAWGVHCGMWVVFNPVLLVVLKRVMGLGR